MKIETFELYLDEDTVFVMYTDVNNLIERLRMYKPEVTFINSNSTNVKDRYLTVSQNLRKVSENFTAAEINDIFKKDPEIRKLFERMIDSQEKILDQILGRLKLDDKVG